MGSILYGYNVSPSTWLYLSMLLVVGVYFRFGRFWSTRNLDLLLLLGLSPGILLASEPSTADFGYVWLLSVTALLLIRVLVDPWARWRPRFDQNMNTAGLVWLGSCALVFLGTRAIFDQIPVETERTVERANDLLQLRAEEPAEAAEAGPAAALIAAPVHLLFEHLAARTLAILAHLAVVGGLLWIGRWQFDDFKTGVAMATLYLLLPCTAFSIGMVNHVLPAALVLWAFALHRRPIVAGVLFGLACGTLVFPAFIVPLWVAFYGRNGWKRFVAGFAASTAVVVGSLALTTVDMQSFVERTLGSLNWTVLALEGHGESTGFWTDANYWSVYRIPVMTAYAVMGVVMLFWPRPKTVELLLAQSTAMTIGAQFWYPQQAGTYVLWYLPLLLTIVFRPRMARTFRTEESETVSAVRTTGTDVTSAVTAATSTSLLR